MGNHNKNINLAALKGNRLRKENIKSLLVFLFSFAVIFFYQQKIIINNRTGILIGILSLIIFLISIYNIKFGLYFFILLTPLVNFLPRVFKENDFPVLLFLFFSLFLGFIVNNWLARLEGKKRNNFFVKDQKVSLTILTIIILLFISLIITIFRYSNFFPFFIPRYVNLSVNVNGLVSNDAISLVIGSFFNNICGPVLLILILNILDNFDDIKDILKIIALSSFFSFIILIIQRRYEANFGNFEPWISSQRYNATFTDPNALGSYTVLIIPVMLIAIFYFNKWYYKFFMFVSCTILFILMLSSGSRSALIGILFSLFVFIVIGLIYFARKVKTFTRLKRIVSIVSIILIFVILVSSIFFVFFTDNAIRNKLLSSGLIARASETVKTFISFYEKDGFIESIKSISNYRYILWERAFQMGKDHLNSGVGIGAFIIELPDYHWRYNRGFLQVDYAGNYYLQIFAELGLPGLFLHIFLFYLILKRSIHFFKTSNKKIANRSNLLFVGLFNSFVTMIFVLIFGSHTNNIEVQFTFWLVIALVLLVTFIKLPFNKSNKVITFKNYINNDLEEGVSTGRGLFGMNLTQKICLIIIILVFSFNFLQASFTDLSIYKKQNELRWVDSGRGNIFGFYESIDGSKSGPRYTGPVAGISLKKEGNYLTFALKAKNPDIENNPLYVKIYLDYKLIREQKLNDDKWHKLTINLENVANDNIMITLVNSRTWKPKDFGIEDDNRDLGVMISSMEFFN